MQKKILLMLSVLLVMITSVAYSALSTSLSITSEVKFRILADIRVNSVTFVSASGAEIGYESEYSKNTVSNGFTLPTSGSSISYRVHIDNAGDVDYSIYDILKTTNNNGLNVAVSGYNMRDVIPAKTSVDLVLTYTTSSPSESVINVVNTFDFKRVFYVRYETGTSEVIPAQIKYQGVNLALTNTQPTKNGYTFSKWNTKSDGSGVNYNSGASYTVDEDVTLYARYNLATYNINYVLNGGTNNANNPSTYTIESDNITLADASKTGYTFKGWTGNGTTTPTKNLVLPTGSYGDKTFTAVFADETDPEITVTSQDGTINYLTTAQTINAAFNASNASIAYKINATDEGSGISTIEYAITNSATAPTSGWTSTTNGNHSDIKNRGSYYLHVRATDQDGNEKVVTTKLITIRFRVAYYDYFNASTTVSENQYYTGTALTSRTPSAHSGYSFDGWYNSTALTTKIVNANTSYTPTGSIQLYGKWTPVDYAITYALNNGTNNSNNPDSYNIESENITLAAPSKTLTFKGNYNAISGANAANGTVTIGSNTTKAQTFTGWTGSNGTTAQTSVTIPTGSTGDKSYTAHWTAVAGTVPTVTRTGYTCGWSTSSTGTTIEITSGGTFPTSLITEGMSSTVNLYAVCNPNTYQLTINPNGGTYNSTTSNSTKTMTYDSSNNNDIGVPTRSGYTFDGWYIEANSKTNQLFNNTGKNTALSGYFSAAYDTGVWKKTSPVTVYAHWSKAASSLTNSVSPTTYIYDGTAKSPAETVKDGSTTLTSGTDYTVAFSNNTNVGTATATITGKNVYNATTKAYYTGTATVNYYINNAKITWDTNSCGTISGTSPAYVRKGSTGVFTEIRNSTAGTIPTVSKSGYKFNGWYDGSTKVINADGTIVAGVSNWTDSSKNWLVTQDKTLTASCTRQDFEITYSMNNGTNNANNPSSYNTESSAITLLAPTKTLTFKGNYNSTSGTNAASGQVTIGSNTTQAQTFAGWTGSNGSTAQTSVTIAAGSTGNKSYTAHWTAVAGTLPTVTRTGYTCGWSTSSTGTTIQYASGGTYPTTAITEGMSTTVNLYAVCNPNTYQLTINPQGGTYNSTTNNSTKTMTYDSSNNNDIGVPTRSGYTFDGWYIEANSKTNQLFNNTGKNTALSGYFSAAYSTGVWEKTSPVTVYAHWSKAASSLTNSVSPTTYIYDGTAKSPTPTIKDGSTTLTSGTDYTISYSNNTNVGTATATITGKNVYNATTKAYYTGTATVNFAINNAKLTFDKGSCDITYGTTTLYTKKGATGVYTGVQNTTAGTIPTASKTGYTFNGWYTASTGGSKVLNANGSFTGTAVTNYTTTNAWNTTADQTLYAQCSPATYTVTANANGGSISSTTGWTGTGSTSTKSVTYASAYGTLPTVSKTGYTFNGWSLLPQGYKQVEYIESTGTQYIDTGAQIFNKDSHEIVMDMTPTKFYSYNQLFGSTYDGDTFEAWIYSTGNLNGRYNGAYYGSQNALTVNTRYLISHSKQGANLYKFVDGTLVSGGATNATTSTTTATLILFKSGSDYSKFKLYASKIYANGELVRDFVPCINDSTGKAGLYDLVTNTFYGNAATSGNDFTVPSTETYITSSTIVTTASNHNIYAHYSINNPATPTISGGATKVYGSSATTLTCSTSTNYASGTSKYYSFGYATSDGGTPGNWTTASTTATLNIAADAYVGQRWYSCRVYASDGDQTTSTVASATTADTEMTINNAKITWDANSCGTISGTSPAYVKKGTNGVYTGIRNTTAGTMASVSKTGYTFNGWYDGTTKVINADGTIVASVSNWTDSSKKWLITEDKTLKANCTRDSYTITYSMNNGTNNSNNPSTYTVESAAITLAAPSKTLTFKGNYNSTSGTNAASGQVTIGSNTTQAQTFAGWTGSNGSTAQTSVTIAAGSTGNKSYTAHWTAVAGTLPTVERTGYTCGWNTSASGTTIQYASGGTFPTSYISEGMSTTVNLYAVCNPNTYQLTINPQGGTYNSTTNNSTKTMTYDASTNNDIGVPTRDGYTFDGWYLETNSKTNQLFNNTGKNTALSGYFSAAYSTGVWKKTSPVTVYAHWSKAVSSTTNSVSPTTYIYDGTAKSPIETVKDGSTTLTSGTDYTVAFSNNTNVGTATATITGKNVYNATTKAYYTGTATVNYYINNATLTFDKGSCTSTSGTTTLYTYKGATKVYTGIRNTTEGTIPTASKSGYTFNGWYTAASGGSKVLNANGTFTGTAVTNYTNATSWQTVANQTLYAQCGKDSYSITYSMNNGTNNSNNPSTYTVESEAITLAAPSKTLTFVGNYNATSGANASSGTVTIGSNTAAAQTFAGWTGSNGTTAQTNVTIPSGSTGDKSYTAHWTAVAGTVPTVTRTGYTCGWNRSSTGTTIEIASGGNFPTSYISEGMSSTVNLYAVCTPNTYTIGYTMNGGPNPSTKPTSGTYDANVQISNPGNKTVTVTGNANNSGATVGSATTGTQTFTGWTSTTLGSNAKSGSSTSNYAAWTGTSTKNTYFKNLRESGTVTMVANWSGTVTLPTLSRAGYTCKWYTEATGGSEMGGSGATWTIPSASSTAVTAYARCTINSYTLTINPNGGTYNSTTSNTTVTQNYGTTYNVANNPTKAGYVFGGWKLTSGNGDITYFQDSEKLKQYLINSSSANTPGVYNNNGNGTVTHTIISDSTSSTGYSMKIVTNGSANPGAGGFVNSNNSTSGAIYYHKIVAKVPSGYTLNIASNSMGIGYGYYWVTDNAGTGDWKTYIYATYSGQNGNFSSFGHVYASGSNNTSVTWYINESTMYIKGTTLAQTQASNEVFRFVASNATLTAQWNNSGAAVTFDTNGGSWNTSYVANWTNGFYGVTSTIAKRDYVFGNSYGTHPGSTNYYWTPDSRVISKTGNTFAGWYTAETGGTQVFDADGKLKASVSGYSDANSKWTKYDSNVTLYARWSAVDHTVTYNTTENGGTGTVASQTVGYGSSIPLPTTGASKSGWTFVGWNTDKNATSALSSLTMGLDNVTLYAIYRKEAVTLTANWNANGATLSSTSQSSCQLASVYNNNTQATSCQVTAPTITRANYNIIGFNTTSTATTNNSSYNVSTGKLTLTSSNTGNTWYAITQAQPQLTATFAANNGATVASTSASCYVVGSNTSCQVTAPSVTPQSGFSHIGFNTTTSATSNSSSYNTSTNKLTISANGTWYPITRAQFTGTFTIQDSNAATQSGGTPSCYKYNGPGSCNIVAPTLTAKSGYTVLGWNTNQNATSASYASGATISISENTQFYSITKASTAITITFDRNTANSKAISQTPSGGTASTDTTVAVSCEKVNGATSCSVTSPTMAVTAGYHAVGYNTSATATSSSWNVNTAKSVSANATYYAITAPNTYSIKFNANCPTGTTASGTMSDLSMTYGTAKNLTANAFGCTNREFVGWATSASGTVAYNNQASVNNLTTTNGGTFNLYAKWRLVTPPLPTTSGGTTRVYGSAGDVILTCNDNINMSSYPSGAVKYYSFGYSTTSDGNLGSWSTDQQSNTYSVSTNYIGTRYYACKVYVSTSTEASDVTIGTTRTSLTVRNAKITFNANGCGTITGTNPAYVQKGIANVYTGETNSTNGTIPYTSATGKTFTGWYSGSTQVINASKVVNASVSGWTDSQKKWLITEDKTLTAGCSNDPYTIGYTMNGGTNNSNNPLNYTVASPDITLAAPTKVLTFHGNANGVNNVSIGNDTTKDQGFAGWTGSNGTTAQTSVTITSGSTGNKSYTAHWTAVAGTLPTVELDGYTCKWNTKSDGTGTDYASGGTFPASAISESMATTVNLYAVCTQSSYTITANVNGGTISTLNGWTASGNNATKLIASGGTYGTLPTVTAPTGKVFVGWYTQASGGTQITSSTQLVSNSSHIIYAHYADVWAENIGYSRTFGSVVCSDVQCAIDQLWAMLSQY